MESNNVNERTALLHNDTNTDDDSSSNLASGIDEGISNFTGRNNGNIQVGNAKYENSTIEEHVIDKPADVIVYTRRFYILFLFSMLALTQGGVWNTWGPISQSANHVFGWDDSDIALLANWGPISYVISMFFFSWVLDVKGLRLACILCSFLVAAGTGLRCITLQQPWVNWLMHTGQLLNGFGGPVAMAACTVVSSVWFPPHQRTTSTSIGSLFNVLGVAVSFIIGPLLVPQHDLSCNSTEILNHSVYNDIGGGILDIHNQSVSGCINNTKFAEYIKEEGDGIQTLLCVEFGAAGAIFLAILLYFPSKPPHPPSVTASIERVDFKTGVKSLLKHRQFWMISIIYGVCVGVLGTWMSVLDLNFSPLGVTQDEAGWIGFYSTVAGTVVGLVVARFADIFSKHMKVYMVVLFIVAIGMFVWITLISIHVLPYNIVYLYTAIIGGNMCLNGTVPLLYELCCEVTFPIAEGVTCGALTLCYNVAGLIFLFIMMIPNIGNSWTNWCMVGVVLFGIPVLLMVKETYNRLDVDIEVKPPDQKAPINE